MSHTHLEFAAKSVQCVEFMVEDNHTHLQEKYHVKSCPQTNVNPIKLACLVIYPFAQLNAPNAPTKHDS